MNIQVISVSFVITLNTILHFMDDILSSMNQVPGSTTYSLALYYMMNTPLEDVPLLESFVKGDDSYRNSRFKLIPYISKVCTYSVVFPLIVIRAKVSVP